MFKGNKRQSKYIKKIASTLRTFSRSYLQETRTERKRKKKNPQSKTCCKIRKYIKTE